MPSASLSNGKPRLARALFDVTSGGVFWMVAVGPDRCAMRVLLLSFIASPQFCSKSRYPGIAVRVSPHPQPINNEFWLPRLREGHAHNAVAGNDGGKPSSDRFCSPEG